MLRVYCKFVGDLKQWLWFQTILDIDFVCFEGVVIDILELLFLIFILSTEMEIIG